MRVMKYSVEEYKDALICGVMAAAAMVEMMALVWVFG